MEHKLITILTNTSKKGKLDTRSLPCQVLDFENKRCFVLDETKRTLQQKRFYITPGCRIIDDGNTYYIHEVLYWPRPLHPILVVRLDFPV